MLKAIWQWLFGGYTCDDCRQWIPRRRGRANVSIEEQEVPVPPWPCTKLMSFVILRCPECTKVEHKRATREKTAKAESYEMLQAFRRGDFEHVEQEEVTS